MFLCHIHNVLYQILFVILIEIVTVESLGPIQYWKGINQRRSGNVPSKREQQSTEKSTSENSLKLHLRSIRHTNDPEKFHETDDELLSYLDPYNLQAQLKRIASRFPLANITTEVIGKTVEYKDIVLLKITERPKTRFKLRSGKYADDEYEKQIIFIVHGLSVQGMTFIPCLWEVEHFQRLLAYYLAHLDKFDIFLMPMANPDGVVYPVTFWNKNVSPQKACPGVALDRNFDVAWNFSRISSSCSPLYPGYAPFTEAETQAIRGIFHYYHHKIVAYINVHGGGYSENTFKGEAVLYPKGYTDLQEDDDVYLDLKGEVDEVMRNLSFRVMSVTVDTLYSWYGPISGSSVDYADTVYRIPFSLEFVMQPYWKSFNYEIFQSVIEYDTLNTIWSRVIDAVFNYIWRTSHNDGERRRINNIN